MRKTLAIFIFIAAAVAAWAQSNTGTQAKPAVKPPVHHAAAAANEPTAIFDTTAGTLRCKLFEKETPITVKNFIDLATGAKDWTNPVSHATKHNTPLYDGTIFHRVIPEFMIQGGDPAGNGTGDAGYTFRDEFVPTLKFDRPGRLAMANSGPNTNSSQFFITEDAAHSAHLTGHHTIFGQCDDASVALVKQIARIAADPRNNRPFRPVKINHLKIVRGAAAAAPAKSAATTSKKPTTAAPKAPSSPN
jgi:peptidyl-prolyl cis-trans isomerase A (cyclophilin A)